MVFNENLRSPSRKNYSIPGGVKMFLRDVDSVLEKDWDGVGSITSATIGQTITYLDHWTTRKGQRSKDRSEISEKEMSVSIDLEELNLPNLMRLFGKVGGVEQVTYDVREACVVKNPGAGGVIQLPNEDIVPDSAIVRTPTMELLDIVEFVQGPGNDFVEDEFDGSILIDPAGALVDTVAFPRIHILYRKNVETQRFEILSGDEVNVSASFIANSKKGTKVLYDFPFAQIRANGDFSVGDGSTWMTFPLSLMVLADETGLHGHCHVVKEDEFSK